MTESLATVTSINTGMPAEDLPHDPTLGLSGRRKAAILILQLDAETSAKVLAELTDLELEELAAEIARSGEVPSDVSAGVLREFGVLQSSGSAFVHGGMDQTRALLMAAVGTDRAGAILDRLSTSMFAPPFKFLQNADARQLLSFISDEHPQTIALVLAHVPAQLASRVLAGLTSGLQADVAHRIATMDQTSPDIIRQIESSLERRMANLLVPSDMSSVGGVVPLVDIINRADRGTERLILEGLEKRDPKLAEEVRGRMFMFEDLVNLEDRAIQLVLRQVEIGSLAVALKGVGQTVQNKISKNLSERAAITLLEEIELLGPVRVQSVEEAQSEVVRVIRELETAGDIILRRGDEDEFVA